MFHLGNRFSFSNSDCYVNINGTHFVFNDRFTFHCRLRNRLDLLQNTLLSFLLLQSIMFLIRADCGLSLLLSTSLSLFAFQPLTFLLSVSHNNVTLLFGQTAHFRQLIGLDDRQIVETQEALSHQTFRQIGRDTWRLRKCLDGAFELFVKLLSRHHLNIPTHQFRSEANVLTTLADCK